MFIERLIDNAEVGELRSAVEHFVSSISGLHHEFKVVVGHRDSFPTGYPAAFVDIYPSGWGTPFYDKFGGLFVRVWRVGEPTQLIYGLWIGGPRAEQNPARQAVQYVRQRLGQDLLSFEKGHGFQHLAWKDRYVKEWAPASTSVRAAVRQFDLFVTFRREQIETSKRIEPDLENLVRFLDGALSKLGTPISFAKAVRDATSGLGQEDQPSLLSQISSATNSAAAIDWGLADKPIWNGLKGLEEPYHRAISALKAGKHVIFLGPPGSGKTELAEVICSTLERASKSVTATSEWGAFETIGGYLPSPDKEATSSISLDFNPGLIIQALEDNEWLVLDELNRADLDKCFGELFTLLGGGQKSVRLPFKRRSPEGIYRQVVLSHARETEDDDVILIPPSWRIIGTMNTTDKASLYQLSYAFMRRFAFINVGVPTPTDYSEILSSAISAAKIYDGDEAAAAALKDRLSNLFASTDAGTLRAAEIEFGPALALDVIRYIASRSATLGDGVALVEEALELLVFPQMEGKRQKYAAITAALGAVLGRALTDDADRSLRMWTGHYE